MTPIAMHPIGVVRASADPPARHHSVSSREGTLVIDEAYREGLEGLRRGQRIVVIFHFHRSPPFESGLLRQKPAHRQAPTGVFNLCSPVRPNPIGLSILEVLLVEGNRIHVRGIDMLDGTPILDIKPDKGGEGKGLGGQGDKLLKKMFPFRCPGA